MKKTDDILETNKKQKEFYNNIKKNFFSEIWSNFRNGLLNKIRKNTGIQHQAYQLHKEWFGDLSNKKSTRFGLLCGKLLVLLSCGTFKAVFWN